MVPGKIIDREMVRHSTELTAGLVTDDVKEDSTGPVQFFLGERHNHKRNKDKSGREDIAWKDHPGGYEVHM